MTSAGQDDPSRTPAEQRMIDTVARDRGEEWAEERSELILAQARLIGVVPDEEANTAADIRNTLDDGYLFAVTYRDGESETTVLATPHEISRPSAKPLDDTPVFKFRAVTDDQTFRLRISEIADVQQRSIDDVPERRWCDLTAALVGVAKESPARIPPGDARTLVAWAQDNDEGKKPALQLARRLLCAHGRVPDDLAESTVELITASKAGPDAENLWTEAVYAREVARCIAELAESDPAVAVDTVPQLAIAAESDDRKTREWSMYSFNKIAAEHPEERLPAIDVLVDCITAGEEALRANALSALGRIVNSYPQQADPIASDIAELLGSEDPKSRANAAGVLGDLANEHTDTAIRYASDIARLLTDDDAEVRRNASITLLRAGEADPAAVSAEHEQLEAALNADDPEVRANACALIANATAPVSKARLRELQSDDQDETVRDRAARALRRLD